MKSTIKDIFHGVRGQMGTMRMPKEHFERKNTDKAYDELKENLTAEQLQLHQKYVDELIDIYCDEVDFYFTEGFKLGLLIGLECTE